MKSQITGERLIRVLYLDLDGTVRKGFDELGQWVNGPADVEVYPEAIRQMGRWKRDGGRIVAVSNQGGVALGHVTQEAVAEAMVETQLRRGSRRSCRLAVCSTRCESSPL